MSSHAITKDYKPFYFEAFYKIQFEKGTEAANNIIDSVLVTYAGDCMREKLKISRKKGRQGWWMEEASIASLYVALGEHVAKGDMVDVINLAAMIHARECGVYSEVQS